MSIGSLRRAVRADIAAMHRVRMSVRENRLQTVVLTDDDYLAAIEPPGRGWLLEVDGKLAGFAVANGSTGNVWALFVHPDYEARGCGRTLHDAMVAWLWEQGLERLSLTTAPGTRAERFYVAAGWHNRGTTESGEIRFELTRTPHDADATQPAAAAVSEETMETTRHPMTLREVVLRLPGMEAASVLRDVPYGTASPSQRMDVYRPPGAREEPLPAVVLVTGYSDVGGRKMLGCSLKDMAAYGGWAQLIAAYGMVAVAYENEDPIRDARAVFEHIKTHAASIGIDPTRLAVWSCSGNVPNALAVAQAEAVACAALCYGYLLDENGFDEVATAAAAFGFVTGAPPGFDALRDVPMLIVRAGRDETPGLNASLDRFVARALAENARVSVLNHPDGQHAFDLMDDTDRSRCAIRQILSFLTAHLL